MLLVAFNVTMLVGAANDIALVPLTIAGCVGIALVVADLRAGT